MPSVTVTLQIGVGLMLLYTFGEFIWLAFIRKSAAFRSDFLQPLKNLVFVALGGALLFRIAPLVAVAALAEIGNQLSPVSLPTAWYIWPVALIVYEFWYWLQHFLAHKVRLLWCIHSPHHAPATINMLVGTNHHVLESLIYFPLFFGFLTGLCGVPAEMVVVINLIDALWGSLLHISPQIVKRRYGALEYVMQTPSFHRAHHAKNVRYMDSNYNSITLFWDWIFRTRVRLDDAEPVDYGITRPVRVDSFRDVQFGEFAALWRDIRNAPGLINKCCYALMPPGWSHTGEHHTVSMQKRRLAAQESTTGEAT